MTRIDRCLLAATAALLLAAGAAQAQVDAFQKQIPAADVRELEQARALRARKQPAEAIKILEPLVARQPQFFNAQYELGLAISDTSPESGKAIPALEKAAALKRAHPEVTDAHVFNTLGWAYMLSGQPKPAEAAFKEAEARRDQLTPDVQRRLYNNLGFLYLSTGRRDAAEKYLHTAAEKYDSAQARTNLKTLNALKERDKMQVKH
jgi:tetratricopeptide (TPR) repeat protein